MNAVVARCLAVPLLLVTPALLFAADKGATIPASTKVDGKVIGITDGDTVTVLVGTTAYRIRLDGIDAPESSQAFGVKSRAELFSKVFGKSVTVESKGPDKDNFTLGTILADGKSINLEMVAEGFAWHDKQYSKDKAIAKAEQEARAAKRGLWADENPTPPWEFRRSQKPTGTSSKQPATPKTTSGTTNRAASQAKGATASKDEKAYWLTTKSGIRHNSTCRYYKNGQGRSCTKDEGRACKICGG